MWPFKKKPVLTEPKKEVPKTEEPKTEANINLKMFFDPTTNQLKVKIERPEPPVQVEQPAQPEKVEQPMQAVKEEPAPARQVKMECPNCAKPLEKYSTHRFKCPHCRGWIYYRDSTLWTMADFDRNREECHWRRNEEWQQQQLVEGLTSLGLTEEQFRRRELELTQKDGAAPTRSSVIMSLFNESILKVKDLHEQERRYHDLAILLNRGGEDVFHILRAAAKAKLAAYKKDGLKKVNILNSQMCGACTRQYGRVMTIAKADETMPIPIKTCKNFPYNEEKPFCICSFEPEYDDEYWDKHSG